MHVADGRLYLPGYSGAEEGMMDVEMFGLLWGALLAAVFVAYEHMRMEE